MHSQITRPNDPTKTSPLSGTWLQKAGPGTYFVALFFQVLGVFFPTRLQSQSQGSEPSYNYSQQHLLFPWFPSTTQTWKTTSRPTTRHGPNDGSGLSQVVGSVYSLSPSLVRTFGGTTEQTLQAKSSFGGRSPSSGTCGHPDVHQSFITT